jgi:hypothetical protein
MKKGKGAKYKAAHGKGKVFKTQEGSKTRVCPYSVGGNCLVALPVDNFRFCRDGGCKGISLPSNSRNCHYAYHVWEDNIRPFISSNYLSKKGVMEYHISHLLLCHHSLRNSFYGFENDSLVSKKRKFQSSILSYKINAFLSKQSKKKSYCEWILCILSN